MHMLLPLQPLCAPEKAAARKAALFESATGDAANPFEAGNVQLASM
jgi:hypothetical protein